MARKNTVRGAFRLIGLGTALVAFWPLAGIISSPIAAEEPVTVIGVALSDKGDFAIVDDAVAEAQAVEAARAIGLESKKRKENEGRWEDIGKQGHEDDEQGQDRVRASFFRAWISHIIDHLSDPRPDDLFPLKKTSPANELQNNETIVIAEAMRITGGAPPFIANTDVAGLAGNKQKDVITNTGDLTVQSEAIIELSDLTSDLVGIGDTSRRAVASAEGMTGGKGDDRISNAGRMTVTADAIVKATGIDINLISGAGNIDAANQASAAATGFDGVRGHDQILNDGPTAVTANAISQSGEARFNRFDVAQGEQVRAIMLTDARAVAVGIDGGKGSDQITNAAPLDVRSSAEAKMLDPEVTEVDLSSVDLSTTADAGAYGIDGGRGRDDISNSGALNVNAVANADSTNLKFTGTTVSSGNSAIASKAYAVAVDGGSGKDRITNSGTMTVTSDAQSSTTDFSATLFDLTLIPDPIGSNIQSSTTSKAKVMGIVGGRGDDTVFNVGSLTAVAKATTDTRSFSWGVNELSDPSNVQEFLDPFDQPLINADTKAQTQATGIHGGKGDDTIINSGRLILEASAKAGALDVSLAFPVPEELEIPLLDFVPSVSTASLATKSSSSAKGVSTGGGQDSVTNDGLVTVDAASKSESDNISATLLPDLSGDDEGDGKEFSLSLGAGLVDVGARAKATASGVETGKNSDRVTNNQKVYAKATADAVVNNVNVNLAQSDDTVAVNALLARASTNARADVTGISTSSGKDAIDNQGEVLAEALADSDSDAVGVDAQILKDTRLAVGGKLLDAKTEAHATSTGINAGSRRDVVHNAGSTTARSRADADALGVDVDIRAQTTTKDVAIIGQGVWVSANTIANADAKGIVGAKGKDRIRNSGTVDADAFADAKSEGVAVTGVGTKKGASVGVAVAEGRSEGTASSSGIAGGKNSDTIINSGRVKSMAVSEAEATDLSVSLTLTAKGAPMTGTAADGSTRAASTAEGISGGGGEDRIQNEGAIDVLSNAKAESVSVAVSGNGVGTGLGLGFAFSRATAEAIADSTGLSGGRSKDRLTNAGLIRSHAVSKAVAGSGALAAGGSGTGVTVQGAAADGSTKGASTAVGISGGGGRDEIRNDGVVDVLADTDAVSVSVAVSGSGAGTGIGAGQTFSRADTQAYATGKGVMLGGLDGARDDDDDVHDFDRVDNFGTIAATSRANANADSISVQLGITGTGLQVGGALASARTMADADATGIEGSDHRDAIINHGAVEAVSDAGATATSVGVSLNAALTGATLGAAITDATTTAEANSTGIAGNDGHDLLSNRGSATARSTASAKAASVAVSAGLSFVPLNAAIATSTATARATATAIDGGEGADVIANQGTIDAQAITTARGTAVSAAPIGFGIAEATTTATADATGIFSGEGEDRVHTQEPLAVGNDESPFTAGSEASARGLTVAGGFSGFFKGDASSTATARSAGIDLGQGHDLVINDARMEISAKAFGASASGSIAIVGVAAADASSTVNAHAYGIDGGSGHDIIVNRAPLTVAAGNPLMAPDTNRCATADAGGGACARSLSRSINAIGAASADAPSTANASAKGLNGGGGGDMIMSLGTVAVSALARGDADGRTVGVIGASSAKATTTANAMAVGIDGGAGHDLVEIDGAVTASAASKTYTRGLSARIVGAASSSVGTIANADAIGIEGGEGDDTIVNHAVGSISASANATSGAESASWVFSGRATSEATLGSLVNATGIAGGEGADRLDNQGLIDVQSNATLDTTETSFNFLGRAATAARIVANAASTGIAGGAGPNSIHNEGQIMVRAQAAPKATGGAKSVIGNAVSGAAVSGEARATGVEGGRSEDHVVNAGQLIVKASANPRSLNNADAGLFFADGKTRSTASSSNSGLGVDLGHGQNMLLNEGLIDLNVAGTARAEAASDGDLLLGFIGSSDANAISTASVKLSEVIGILAGHGDDTIINEGELTVTARPSATARSNADGDGLGGEGTAIATARANNARAAGLRIGNGDNRLRNNGTITVRAEPSANADADSDADGVKSKDPDSRATASVSANNAQAVGIQTGHGGNWIFNAGALTVTSAPKADKAEANAGFGEKDDVSIIDAFATTTATANDAQATGIWTGNGDNVIRNEGTITTESRPHAKADSTAKGIGVTGDAEARATAEADDALAIGIHTGNGSNEIINEGTISVTAAPVANADAEASPGKTLIGSGEKVLQRRSSTADPQAIGIWTGSGNDLIVNNGSITTTVDSSAAGVGIRVGAGNDTVMLGDGSLIRGALDLGLDDDTLQLSGTPVVDGPILDGGGTDTLVFEGSGAFADPLTDFEIAVKSGGGTFSLPRLQTMKRVEVDRGRLQIDSNYRMSPGSTFQAKVFADGSHGQLDVGGIAKLDGELVVRKGSGLYTDGTTYDILTAGLVDGEFTKETLPEPTPLLSFEVAKTDSRVQVEASVNSFSSATQEGSGLEQSIARQLDKMLPTATGELAEVIGGIQGLSAKSEIEDAFVSLSPDSYDSFSTSMMVSLDRSILSAHDRMAGMRARIGPHDDQGLPTFLASDQTLSLTSNGAASPQADIPFGIWLMNFGGDDQFETGRGRSGLDFNTHGTAFGFDFPVNEKFMMGVGHASTTTGVAFDSGFASSTVESQLTSAYGSYFLDDRTYIESVLSFGNSGSKHVRRVTAGSSEQVTSSHHEGQLFSAFVEAGHAVPVGTWQSEAFGSLLYASLYEDGFEEKGAGGLDLSVDERRVDTLKSELGLRVARPIETEFGRLTAQLDLAWVHDFDIGNRDTTAQFRGAPDTSFTVPERKIASDGMRLGGALTLAGDNLDLSAKFDAELRESERDLSGLIRVRLKF